MKYFTAVLTLICCTGVVVHSAAAERGRFVDAHEALLLRDSAQFFGSSKPFIDRVDAADFLESVVPVGTTYSDAKKKFAELMERVEMGQRMHVRIFLNEKSIVVSFIRVVFPRTPTTVSVTYTLGFDAGKRREKESLVPTYDVEAYHGPPPGKNDIEPEKEPNQ